MNELTVEYRKQKHMFIWLIPLVFLVEHRRPRRPLRL